MTAQSRKNRKYVFLGAGMFTDKDAALRPALLEICHGLAIPGISEQSLSLGRRKGLRSCSSIDENVLAG